MKKTILVYSITVVALNALIALGYTVTIVGAKS